MISTLFWKVNHLPGASHFTSKVDLAKHVANFSFIPKSFLLPKHYSKLVQYHKEHNESILWLKKGKSHRGIKIVDPYDTSLGNKDDIEGVAQAFIRPYLIDK